MQLWITTALLALASKAVMGAPHPMEGTEPAACYNKCYWDASVCWCMNIYGYNVRASDDWCFYAQDDEDWERNYGKKEEKQQSEEEEEYEDEDEDEDEEEEEGEDENEEEEEGEDENEDEDEGQD
ncbi:hypothetical protein CFO_g5501 [Ceratocystis platani]|uniref:Uncharacterized protein n=1 Tax=Ceratocystis fimbriata f. sp. platani TaxID=88771 RepID=A0A0F8AZ75_CERFI|nr:hypothetical protein CFO_g5501 [Ceratocystis platani]